jgi:hypothetical protein
VTDILPGLPLASFLDAQGHRITVEVTRSGLAVIFARTPDGSLESGRPALSPENSRELGLVLIAFADREVPG